MTPPKPRPAQNARVAITNVNLLKRRIDACLQSSMSSTQQGGDVVIADIRFRQVQDLQSQIAELTQLNSHLRTKATGGESVEPERPETKRRHSEAQLGVSPSPHRIAAPVMRNFDHVRDNIEIHSRGIFSAPYPNGTTSTRMGPSLPELPPRADFARLSRSYLDSVHKWYPALHWPTFQHEVDEMYTTRSFERMSREWTGLFFAILACGSLQAEAVQHGSMPSSLKGTSYFEFATQVLMPWPQELTIEHAQAALLLSIFAAEQNWKSVGSMWLGSAVRAAQELNVHCDGNIGSVVDNEIRRRLWWAIYTRDR